MSRIVPQWLKAVPLVFHTAGLKARPFNNAA